MTEATHGYVDLHLHYVPAVDDGVRDTDAGLALCRGLKRLGYSRVVATPHIRTAMYDNRRDNLQAAFDAFAEQAAGDPDMPELGLAAEHFCDDVFWQLFVDGQALPYPGGHAALIELPEALIPVGIEQRFFEMRVRGVSPVLAHPERYRPLFARSEPIETMVHAGLMLQLDLMSLVGRYGRRPRKAAERLLSEEAYFIACTDSHRPDDLPRVTQAMDRLFELAGDEYANRLLRDNPGRILAGDIDM